MTLSALLVSLGLALAAAGLAALFWCVRLARKVQAGEVAEAELSAIFARLSAVNMAAMGAAMLGLSLLLIGLIL